MPDPDSCSRLRIERKIDLYEDRVLRKIDEIVANEQFEQARACFDFWGENVPRRPGPGKSYEDHLYERAVEIDPEGDFRRVLLLLRELYNRSPFWLSRRSWGIGLRPGSSRGYDGQESQRLTVSVSGHLAQHP